MKNIRVFVSEIFQILEMTFSIYLNRRVFVMNIITLSSAELAQRTVIVKKPTRLCMFIDVPRKTQMVVTRTSLQRLSFVVFHK